MMRKISVIIPLYNSQNSIGDTISSIQQQSYPVYEILIYDDNSSDSSADIVRKLSMSDSKLKVFYGMTNKGAGYARNFLLQHVTGDIIAFLDADDIWYPNKLSVQICAMERTGGQLITCGYDIFSSNGDYVGCRLPPKKITLKKLFISNWIPTSMTIFEKSLLGTTSMPSLRRRQDYAYWIKLLQLNPGLKCVGLSDVLGAYNRSDYSLSSSNLKNFLSNYRLFRHELKFNFLICILILLLNIIVRLTRK